MPAADVQRDSTRTPALLIGFTFAVAVGIFAQEQTAAIVATLLIDALPTWLAIAGVTLFGTAIARRVDPTAPRSLLLATGGGIGLGVVATVALLLGLGGWLNIATAAALLSVLGVAGIADVLTGKRFWLRVEHSTETRGFQVLLWLLPAVALGLACVAASLPAGVLWGNEPNAYDVLSYHLQIPREWFALGQIVPLEHNAFSRFPLATEVLFLVGMHLRGDPWQAQFVAHFTNVAIAALFVLGVYGGVRGIGGSRLSATIAAVVAATVPWTLMLASLAYNDALLMLAGALTAAWIARAIATGSIKAAALAGLGAGLGASAKYTGVPMLIVLGAVALVIGLLMHRGTTASPEGEAVPSSDAPPPTRLPLRVKPWHSTVAFLVAAVVLPLPWFVRNAIWYGNPVSPLAASVFGVEGWSLEQIDRWQEAHSLPMTRAPGQLFNDVLINGNFAWLLWPLAIVGLVLAARSRRRGIGIAIAVWLIGMLLVWATATHMIGRFVVVAIGPAALAIGLVQWERQRIAGAIVAAAVAIAGLGFTAFFAGGRGGLWSLAAQARPFLGVPVAQPPMPFVSSEERRLLNLTNVPTLYRLETAEARDVYLVGDAAAWGYPLDNLHYKVVFDVPPADGALAAWLGDALDTANENALVVIDVGELQRFARTYGTPPLKVELAPDPDSPVPGKVVLTMRRVRELLGR